MKLDNGKVCVLLCVRACARVQCQPGAAIVLANGQPHASLPGPSVALLATRGSCCSPASKVFCLPDNYEVVDRSLDDVRHVLDPHFSAADLPRLDKVCAQGATPASRASALPACSGPVRRCPRARLAAGGDVGPVPRWHRVHARASGAEQHEAPRLCQRHHPDPGAHPRHQVRRCWGARGKETARPAAHGPHQAPAVAAAYLTAPAAASLPVAPSCRDFFLIPSNYKGSRSLLVSRCGELLRKIWNARNFKGQVRRLRQGCARRGARSCMLLRAGLRVAACRCEFQLCPRACAPCRSALTSSCRPSSWHPRSASRSRRSQTRWSLHRGCSMHCTVT